MRQSQVMSARLRIIGDLHAGTYAPGASISVKQTAASLRLSHTPVREALAALAAEGLVTLVDRHGFAVPRLGAQDLAEHLELLALLINAAVETIDPSPLDLATVSTVDPVSAIEAVMAWLAAGCENRQVTRLISRANVTLASYRRVESDVFPGWRTQLADVVAAARPGRKVLGAYWRARITNAPMIVRAVERCYRHPDIFSI